ncbi:hypothetical protein BCR36DRAFT_289835 [Piromyces finnis]|uniref:Uncharacterized protein n=1 Tax=Piromyces finnis TaxID=1754191 RepID=A0A1Y1VAD5_9FUNG|nr:hypothetical protein BCR36DRAFT_289835 [Piromyces finnis]|eukprot:ORX50305.1 hypothetical protein BCR36DRAFT_289835 [Piromyces finnis]
MKISYKIIPVLLTLLNCCNGHNLNNNNNNNNTNENVEDVIDIGVDLSNFKRTTVPPLTSITCGDNTKTCNIGFGEITFNIYNTIWYMTTPVATTEETLRKEHDDTDEFVSMVASIYSYNYYFDVYIYGYLYSGHCVNDRNNKCTVDAFLTDASSFGDIKLDKFEDKSSKLVRFKYTDWTGKCYKTWKLVFDIQGTKDDLEGWFVHSKIKYTDFYPD